MESHVDMVFDRLDTNRDGVITVEEMRRDMFRSGYEVIYTNGDVCYTDHSKKYQSIVRYICDPEEGAQNNKMNDFPQIIPEPGDDYNGVHQCTFHFVWRSKFACSPCQGF